MKLHININPSRAVVAQWLRSQTSLKAATFGQALGPICIRDAVLWIKKRYIEMSGGISTHSDRMPPPKPTYTYKLMIKAKSSKHAVGTSVMLKCPESSSTKGLKLMHMSNSREMFTIDHYPTDTGYLLELIYKRINLEQSIFFSL